jgi:hypothetical protein
MPKENRIKKKLNWKLDHQGSKQKLSVETTSNSTQEWKKLLHLSLVKHTKAANKLPDNLFDDSSPEEEE